MSVPFFLCLIGCIFLGVYAMYRRNLERPVTVDEYHIFHGPNSDCVDCEDK